MRKNILSINSNRPMNYLLQTILSDQYKVIPALDVFQGMYELKRNDEIELIIADVDHNTKESWDFIQHIKTSKLYNKPVIVLTSDKGKRTVEKMAEANVYDFFLKPFDPVELIRTINELVKLNDGVTI